MVAGGVERAFRLDIPESYDGRRALPLVLELHALTVDYRIVPGMTGLATTMAGHAFIGVSPSGLRDGATPFWNAAPVPANEDVAFVRALLDHLEAELCIDTARVLSTGMSNGAQMSSLLACRLSDRITAIAPVSGVEFLEPCRGSPVPIIAFHGTEDPILPYSGGGLNATRIASLHAYDGAVPPGLPEPLGVDESMRRWARHNRCDRRSEEVRLSPEVRKQTWGGCDAPTELYVIEGGGHAWPGRPVPQFEAAYGHGTTEIDATASMLEFFLGAPRQS
jgi:polyhydroxybutyrate depolymerase